MRRCGLVLFVGFALLACGVGRDLEYVDPGISNLAEGPASSAVTDAGTIDATSSPPAPTPSGQAAQTADSSVSARPPNCPVEDDYEIEPNNTAAEPNMFKAGDTCGVLASAADIDFSTFVVKHVNISMEFQADGDARLNYRDMDDPSDMGDVMGNGGSFTIYGATPGHRYSVQVSSPKHLEQGYLITITN